MLLVVRGTKKKAPGQKENVMKKVAIVTGASGESEARLQNDWLKMDFPWS